MGLHELFASKQRQGRVYPQREMCSSLRKWSQEMDRHQEASRRSCVLQELQSWSLLWQEVLNNFLFILFWTSCRINNHEYTIAKPGTKIFWIPGSLLVSLNIIVRKKKYLLIAIFLDQENVNKKNIILCCILYNSICLNISELYYFITYCCFL